MKDTFNYKEYLAEGWLQKENNTENDSRYRDELIRVANDYGVKSENIKWIDEETATFVVPLQAGVCPIPDSLLQDRDVYLEELEITIYAEKYPTSIKVTACPGAGGCSVYLDTGEDYYIGIPDPKNYVKSFKKLAGESDSGIADMINTFVASGGVSFDPETALQSYLEEPSHFERFEDSDMDPEDIEQYVDEEGLAYEDHEVRCNESEWCVAVECGNRGEGGLFFRAPSRTDWTQEIPSRLELVAIYSELDTDNYEMD